MDMKTTISINGKEVEIELTQEQIDKVLEQSITKLWEPVKDEEGYYPDFSSDRIWRSTFWNQIPNKNLIEYGLVFQSKEEAIKTMEIMKAKYGLKKAIYELNKGWEPDFEDRLQQKHYLYLEGATIGIAFNDSCKLFPAWFYLNSYEACIELIKNHEQDLLLVLGE